MMTMTMIMIVIISTKRIWTTALVLFTGNEVYNVTYIVKAEEPNVAAGILIMEQV